jgi:hypothetical protein
MNNVRYLLALLVLLARHSSPARAQDAPPAGGWPLREVPVLTVAPLPPGGLVPYRRGQLWGYADTTGRLVIAPVLGASTGAYGLFRPSGLGYLGAPVLPAAHGPVADNERIVLNARGEFLRVKSSEFAAADSAGRLRALPRSAARHDAGLRAELLRWEQVQVPTRYPVGLAVKQLIDTGAEHWQRSNFEQDLGGGRFTHAHQLSRRPVRTYWRGDRCGGGTRRAVYRYSRLALTDSTGHHLTRHEFSELSAFHERRGWYRVGGRVTDDPRYDGPEHPRYGLLDDRGHRLTPPLFHAYSAFSRGYATVRVRRPDDTPTARRWRYGVLDSLGRLSLPLQDEPLSAPDAAGFVRRLHRDAAGREVVQVLNGRGQPAFANYEFEDAGAFWGGRAWARREGRQGLIDAQGRWVLPARYEALRYARPHPALSQDRRRYGEELDGASPPVHYSPNAAGTEPDSSYLLARRNGRYGVVSRHSGREVVPCRYDSVLTFYQGYGSFRRGGETYFVDAQGRELRLGYYEGLTFDLPQGRFFVLYQTAFDPANQERLSTVVDAAGRQVLPWLSGLRQYLPDGRALVCNRAAEGGRNWTVVDAGGRVLYRTDAELSYLGGAYGQAHWGNSSDRSAAANPGPLPGKGAPWGFLERRHEPLDFNVVHLQLLDANLNPVLRRDFATFELLAGGWLLGFQYNPNKQLYSPTLLRPDGRCYELPAGQSWWLPRPGDNAEGNEPPFRRRGVALTSLGYITQGGRQLWED